jgi:predicted anti-sigma-YlaC factor YlaD
MRGIPSLLMAGLLAFGTAACSVRGMAVNTAANAMAGSGSGFASDDDPELVRAAVPFGLKVMESLLEASPRNRNLLLSLASGFTQYANGFIETDAMPLRYSDPEAYAQARARALRMYLRGRDYGLRGLELRRPGVTLALRLEPEAAVARLGREDVPLLYWTGAAWGAAISAGLEDPALLADFPAVRALLARVLALDPDFDAGAVHEVMLALESVPALMGGSEARARQHFERAVELTAGRKASPYVGLAAGIAVSRQDRAEFEALLRSALAVDVDAEPRLRLVNLISQRRARYLLEQAEYLFLDDYSEEDHAEPENLPLPDESAPTQTWR